MDRGEHNRTEEPDVKTLRSLFTAALMLALASTAAPARAADESPFKFEFHGFVVGSLYLQDQTFLGGQGSGLMFTAPRPSLEMPQPAPTTTKSGTFLAGDVRQTRPIFVVTGPEALGAKPKAHLEFDLFGNSNAGALGYESPNLRLRQAFAELKWGNTTLDAGQHSAQILLAQIPTSVAHITNPVAYGAGLIGWRSIGFRVTHAIPMEAFKLELAAEVSHPKWNDVLSGTACGLSANTSPSEPGCALPGNAPTQISLAWASSMPQLVGRVKAEGKAGDFSWMGWVAGSYEKIDLKGFGSTVAPTGVTLQDLSVETGLTSYAGIVGGRFGYSPVALNFQLYTGRGTGPLAGSMLQFGDIGDFGYYVEVGVNATKQFSIWGIVGGSAVDKEDLQNWVNTPASPTAGGSLTAANTTLRSDNQLFGGMLRYMDGGYAFAAEYYTYTTKWLLGNLAAPLGTTSTSAYQFIVSGGYFF